VSARAALKDCSSSATGAFVTAIDGCLERDRTCLDACRSTRQDCRDGTDLGRALAACQVDLDVAQAKCSGILLPKRHVVCLFQAQIDGFQCRRTAFRDARQNLRACDAAFRQCAGACIPGAPPGGVGPCRADGRSAFKSVLAGCRRAYQVTASACINRDLTCTQQCIGARETCSAPTQATLTAALVSCVAEGSAAVTACSAANPGGGPPLQQCIMTAQASAFTCRDAALQASMAGFEACATQYAKCVYACPRVSP
jgi:hypothetical protein